MDQGRADHRHGKARRQEVQEVKASKINGLALVGKELDNFSGH